ncbi:RidA family protein [Candidatus Pacearchaeota archaeon]|nr:RidA family protein [Candidatus Pacearchaeota archaeon]
MVRKMLRASDGLPFSKAVISGEKYIMEISGQIGLNNDGELTKGIEAQTRKALENVGDILKEIGWSFENIIKVRIFLADMGDYSIVNKIYSGYFKEGFPSRVALAVKELPLGALIEFDCTACGDEYNF